MDTVGIELQTPMIELEHLPEGTAKVSAVVKHGLSFIRCYDKDGKKLKSILYNEKTGSYCEDNSINFSEEGIDYNELLAMGVDKADLDRALSEGVEEPIA